jgi:DNA-binding NarL/FixJ family response regulator
VAGDPSVLVVDDDAIVRAWVRLSLESSEFRVAGEAASAAEAETMLERRRPDLLLLDYRLPDRVATELVPDLRRRGVETPVLIMTANPQPGLNEATREAGAQGVVLKRGSSEELVDALRRVAAGAGVADAGHPRRPTGRGPLTPRERVVLRLAARGLSNPEIARELRIGRESVKTLLHRAFVKLGVRNRTEAVAAAQDRGLL